MLASQASSTPPTTAASSDQMMQDGAGRLWTSLGQSPGWQMAWRRLPVFRRDLERRSAVVSLIVTTPAPPSSSPPTTPASSLAPNSSSTADKPRSDPTRTNRAAAWSSANNLRRNAMSDRIHELLNRNLPEGCGEGDCARCRAAIEVRYTDDCVLDAPPGIFVGHDALDKFAGDLRATHPHFAYTPRAPQSLHNAGRLAWGCGPRGEAPDYTGV